MNTQVAEIQGSPEPAKVDSEAGDSDAAGSAPAAAEASAANAQADATSADAAQNKGGREQERFDKLTRERYEAQARAEIAEARREALEARLAALEQDKAKPRQVAPDTPPTLESVGYDEAKYQAALLAYAQKSVADQLREEFKGEWARREQEQQANSLRSSWQKREADFIKSQPDYVDKVKNDHSLPISKEMGYEIMQMDLGPQVAYYLSENREKAAAIAKLPANAQLRELGRIEGLIESQRAAKAAKPPVSQAPPPPAKVGAEEAAVHAKVDTADSDNLSDAEWARRRNAQELARRKRANS